MVMQHLLNIFILAHCCNTNRVFDVMPSLHVQVKNLEKMEFSDDEVMSLTLEIMQITYGKESVMFMYCIAA